MPNYRRAYVPGGTFFFTVVAYDRQPIFRDELAKTILGEAIRKYQTERPFEINAMVLLPNHLHAIWTLPANDCDYSTRWSGIKAHFSMRYREAGGREAIVTPAQSAERRRGFWQPRFWEHCLEDEDDFEAHFDYIHYNPVKHKLVSCPKHWKETSFHRWVAAGVYDENWACGGTPPDFSRIKHDFGEPD